MSIESASRGFINHAKLAFVKNPAYLLQTLPESERQYKKNNLEKAGRLLSWHIYELPRKLYDLFHNPLVVTVALTALALLTVQLIFYPIITALTIKTVILFAASHIPLWALKLSLYIGTQSAVLGVGLRALGRFSNEELMSKWYRT